MVRPTPSLIQRPAHDAYRYWFYVRLDVDDLALPSHILVQSSCTNLPLQVVACQALLSFWSDAEWLKPFLTSILLVAIVSTTLLPARTYGDLEVVFGTIKLLTAVGLVRRSVFN